MKYTVVKFSENHQSVVYEGDVFREARSWAWHAAHDLIDGGRRITPAGDFSLVAREGALEG